MAHVSTPPDTSLEAERFDEFVELAVDGRPILRVEVLSELKTSDLDDAVLASYINEMGQAIEEDLEDDHDEILDELDPEVLLYDSDEEDWAEIDI